MVKKMIFTVELYDCGNSSIIAVSDSLLKCIDAVNNFQDFPYLADSIIFRVWEHEKEISLSNINGQRADHWWGVEHTGPVTYEEVMKEMK